MRVSEIRVKRICVNQELGVSPLLQTNKLQILEHLEEIIISIDQLRLMPGKKTIFLKDFGELELHFLKLFLNACFH